MYTSRRDRRPIPTDAHAGDRADFLARHAAEAELAAVGPGPARDAFQGAVWDRIIDTRTLLAAAEYVCGSGGAAAGVDGISPADLSAADRVDLARHLHAQLLSGDYRPAPDRLVQIPKGPGRGTRTLSLPAVADRVVQRAILSVIQPYIDPQFSELSFGGRPGRSTADALIAAERVLVGTGHRVVAVADVRTAFDCVPHDRLIQCLQRWLGASPLLDLLDTIITTGRTVGIRQGGALSMMLLNLYLHDTLDRPFAELHPSCRMIRWVDDLLVIAPDRRDAEQAIGTVTGLLDGAGGLRIKDGVRIGDLAADDTVEWLGLTIGIRSGALTAGVPEGRWDDLDRSLTRAHEEDCPTHTAREIVRGWIDAASSVSPMASHIHRLVEMTGARAMDGAITRDEVHSWWMDAHNRYQSKRAQQIGIEGDDCSRMTTPGQDTGQTSGPRAPLVGAFEATFVPIPATDADPSCTPDRTTPTVHVTGIHWPLSSSFKEVITSLDPTGAAVRIARRRPSRAAGTAQAGPHLRRSRGPPITRPPP